MDLWDKCNARSKIEAPKIQPMTTFLPIILGLMIYLCGARITAILLISDGW